MTDLKEIVLTIERGFVTKDANEPVEILGGFTISRVTKNTPEKIMAGIEEDITQVYAEKVPESTNGYVIHGSSPVRQVSDTIPFEEWEFITYFSAVEYKKK